jgi:hypothetical protein
VAGMCVYLAGWTRSRAHLSARLGVKSGSLPQYPSTGGPVFTAGLQYFATVLWEVGNPCSVRNSARARCPAIGRS